MHVRFSSCLGTHVLEDGSEEELGLITGILIHPDTGKVEGFFVRSKKFWRAEEDFLASADIAHWGLAVRVRDADVLSPIEDRIRLMSVAEDGRAILGQKMLTESGTSLGICRDVQFETKTFMVEWFFPKRYFRWRPAIPFSAIVEVRVDGIVVRDPLSAVRERNTVLKTLDTLTETPAPVPPQGA